MRVKECRRCPEFRERVWTQVRFPTGYHKIGVNHRYGYCERHKKRCIKVKKCDLPAVKAGQVEMEA